MKVLSFMMAVAIAIFAVGCSSTSPEEAIRDSAVAKATRVAKQIVDYGNYYGKRPATLEQLTADTLFGIPMPEDSVYSFVYAIGKYHNVLLGDIDLAVIRLEGNLDEDPALDRVDVLIGWDGTEGVKHNFDDLKLFTSKQ